VFTFGDAPFLGSGTAPPGTTQSPAVGIAPTVSGQGYWIAYQINNQIDEFGDAGNLKI
jgi:hypothetical protein